MSCTQAKACGYHQNWITTQSHRGEGGGEGGFGKESHQCWSVVWKKTKFDAPVLMNLVIAKEAAVSASLITGK